MADDARPPTDDDVARRDFGHGIRGYDPAEVVAHLEQVAARLRATREGERAWKQRARELEAEAAWLRAEVDAAARAPAPPALDEDAMVEALGAETANILRQAHEAASELQS